MGILLEVCVIRRELRIINLCDTEGQLSSITVLQLKEKIIEQFGYQWQPSDLRLFCCGRELEEPALLSQCGIRHMSTILVVQRVGLPGGGPLPADMRGAQQFINSSTDMGIQLEVRGITGEKKTIDLCVGELLTGITVLQLKERTIEEFGYQWQPSDLHLFCDGRELEEPDRLSQYGITHMSTIHVVKLLLGGGGRPPPVTGDGGMGDKDGKN